MPKWVQVDNNRLTSIPILDNKKSFSTISQMDGSKLTIVDILYLEIVDEPSCITLPNCRGDKFELKSHFIGQLIHFHSLERENAYYFLKKFNKDCQMLRVSHMSMDTVKLRYIPFSLKDLAKRWLYTLTLGSINSWVVFVWYFKKNIIY
jgi:hypothetical protein